MAACGIAVQTDKHLAVTWEDAKWIYDTGRELGLVHMAGSSVPHCFWRDPWLEHPIDTNIEAAVMLSCACRGLPAAPIAS